MRHGIARRTGTMSCLTATGAPESYRSLPETDIGARSGDGHGFARCVDKWMAKLGGISDEVLYCDAMP